MAISGSAEEGPEQPGQPDQESVAGDPGHAEKPLAHRQQLLVGHCALIQRRNVFFPTATVQNRGTVIGAVPPAGRKELLQQVEPPAVFHGLHEYRDATGLKDPVTLLDRLEDLSLRQMVQNRNSHDYIERVGIDPSKVRNVALLESQDTPFRVASWAAAETRSCPKSTAVTVAPC